RVASCGDLVTSMRVGDRVTAMGYSYCGICIECKNGRYTACKNIKGIPMDRDGALQQMITVPENMAFLIPDSLSMEEAALVEPAANGYAAVERGEIRPGETVVIIGPGPIGLLALQAASHRLPCSLIMLGTRHERLALAKKFGATDTINIYDNEPYDVIMDITASKGADVVFFCGGG
ncbi:MAG: alcohol dehydrogenase catalytic domain-containing protein, partial [Clostridiales bacterium]|nr:alcohol dehydrogenase catalytic domain-containing protein [Clostridiales bacterium]